MADLNHVTLIGRLTRDAELKYTSGGFAISNFSIAVNRRRKNGDQWVDEASFFDINLYGKSAENLKPYLLKGKQVAIDGELRQDRWEQDGQPRSKVVIAANNVQLLGGNPSGNGGGQSAGGYSSNQSRPSSYQSRNNYESPAPQGGYESEPYDAPSYGGGTDSFPEDIPF
ncbi:single-stranded DNA-binding protein [Treponema brennaborense]|uniref:Single-stranded DNA-binding protein n=1 Tax=Treponema brennaborense (strain DSM 12168 / CIP 105900 / DD5/3) TaxID=906968 RepID=F4LN90_TREBD|nr:single-stranded DNA-binding protein [Treponema brennaborense]AEE16855.1 single-strand binding protein [Treponema brennaborense DSM 12168]